MCSGSVDPAYVFKAFEVGADGVVISGCHPGECHYISGNLKAEKMVDTVHELMDTVGLGQERLRLQWVSASEGTLFAKYIEDFVEHLRKLGPNPING